MLWIPNVSLDDAGVYDVVVTNVCGPVLSDPAHLIVCLENPDGDMNGDDNLTSADVPLFIQALVDRVAYDALPFSVDVDLVADLNGDGRFDLGDLGALSALFSGPTSASAGAVPEPTTLSLALILLLGIAIRQPRRVSARPP